MLSLFIHLLLLLLFLLLSLITRNWKVFLFFSYILDKKHHYVFIYILCWFCMALFVLQNNYLFSLHTIYSLRSLYSSFSFDLFQFHFYCYYFSMSNFHFRLRLDVKSSRDTFICERSNEESEMKWTHSHFTMSSIEISKWKTFKIDYKLHLIVMN